MRMNVSENKARVKRNQPLLFHEDIGSVLFDNDLEVIGNIFDNAKLLKGEENV